MFACTPVEAMTSGILCPFVATCFGSSRACFNWKYLCFQTSQPANKYLRLNVKFFPFELKFYFGFATAEQLQHLTTVVRFWAFRFNGYFFQFDRKNSFSRFPTKIRPNGFLFYDRSYLFLFEDPRYVTNK